MYQTIADFVEAEIVEKKSKFIAHLCYVNSEEMAEQEYQNIWLQPKVHWIGYSVPINLTSVHQLFHSVLHHHWILHIPRPLFEYDTHNNYVLHHDTFYNFFGIPVLPFLRN